MFFDKVNNKSYICSRGLLVFVDVNTETILQYIGDDIKDSLKIIKTIASSTNILLDYFQQILKSSLSKFTKIK